MEVLGRFYLEPPDMELNSVYIRQQRHEVYLHDIPAQKPSFLVVDLSFNFISLSYKSPTLRNFTVLYHFFSAFDHMKSTKPY